MTDRQRQTIMMKYMNEHRDTFIKLQQSGENEALQKLFEEVSLQAQPELDAVDVIKLPEEQRAAYTTIGGTPSLDNAYTVFGEVVEGLDVIDKIAKVETN